MKNKLSLYFLSIGMALAGGLNSSFAFTSKEDPALLEAMADMKLPLLVINTVDGEEPTCDAAEPPEGAWGHSITNATKVPASMRIIVQGDTIFDSGEYVKKESGLTVKIRGNNSGRNPKKPYKLKLQKKEDLLFRGDKKRKDKDWVLLRNSSIVSPMGFWTSELIGQEWTPAHQIVNVWMNGTYRGVYVLCEQITVNPDCRISIDEEEGYVVEADPYWWNEDICFPSTLTAPEMKFTYKYPDPEDITDEWHEAVIADVLANEARITDGTFDEVYDCESFAKWLVGWDILGNYDSAGGNMYIVRKDASSKIHMGPLWDFDQALVVDKSWIGLHDGLFYFHHMLQSSNDAFRRAFRQVWQEKGRMVVEALIDRINAFADSPEGADYQWARDIQKTLGIPADSTQPYGGDLEFMRSYAIDFLLRRADWIDSHIDEVCGVEGIGVDFASGDVETAFDMLGRRISPDAPGLQVRNGRKVYVKP